MYTNGRDGRKGPEDPMCSGAIAKGARGTAEGKHKFDCLVDLFGREQRDRFGGGGKESREGFLNHSTCWNGRSFMMRK